MNNGKASVTALVSAFSRAYHSQYDTPKIFDDYIAKDLILPEELDDIKKHMVQGIAFFSKDIATKYKRDADEILKWITHIQLSPTPLARAAYCEQVLDREIKLGAQQYVILGAGFDTFGFRYPELENILEIFEVDLPETQEFKKKRLKETAFNIPGNLHFVAANFSKPFFYQRLGEAGFLPKKTFFSLLGTSYYLTKEELSNLVANLFAIVPAGSSIVFDYADEGLFKTKGIFNRIEHMVKMAAAGGEPMKSCFSYREIEKMMEKSGLLIYEHLSPTDIHSMYFRNRHDALAAFETIHYIHAVKK